MFSEGWRYDDQRVLRCVCRDSKRGIERLANRGSRPEQISMATRYTH
jgi:hypothetical protein